MAKFKFQITKPCNENWNKMAPNGNGRFCDSCAKSVVDFTTILPLEFSSILPKIKINEFAEDLKILN